METINIIELGDKNQYPDDDMLKTILGKSFPAYKKLLELFTKHEMSYEWRYYNDGKAWLCKVQKKKRTIVWMSAWKGYLQATIYLPEKYFCAISELNVSQDSKERFWSTKNVGKSKPYTSKITDEGVLRDFEIVMDFKIGNK